MTKIGQQVGVQRVGERREGKIGQQVGIKPTRAAVLEQQRRVTEK